MAGTVTAKELKKKIDEGKDFVLVEVLLPEKYEEWHIPGAINIPADDIKKMAPDRIEKDKEIIVYCLSLSCQASTRAAKYLEEIGYKDVKDYEGGKADWLEKGYPKEKQG